MRRPATTAAAATLTAIGLALSGALPVLAQSTAGMPVDLVNGSPGVSIRSTGVDSQAGYFVGADGSIQYRDTAGDSSDAVTATPVTTMQPSGFDAPAPAPVSSPEAMADMMVTAPLAADMFDAAPVSNDAVTLDSLQDAFTMQPQPMAAPAPLAIEDVSIDASASMNDAYTLPRAGAVTDSYGYTVENGTVVVNEPMAAPMASPMAAPMAAPMTETYQITVTSPPMQAMPAPLAPLAPAMPTYAEPIHTEPAYAQPTYAEPVIGAPTYTEPFVAETIVAEPFMAAPTYAEPVPAPVTISTVAHEPITDHYASLEPTPLLPSGRDMMGMRGDGSYGPSTIKRAGDGPAGRDSAVYISKSTIVELPVDAHEILVADPTRVRAVLRTARQMVLIGLQAGQTSVTAFDENGKQILSLDATIRYDLRPLRRALADGFPGVPIEIESVLGEVVVTGSTKSVAETEAIRDLVRRYLYSAMLGAGVDANIADIQFVDRLTSSPNGDQILVKVRIAEMRRSVVKQFGVDFNLASDSTLSAAAGGLARNLTDFGSITNAFGVNGAALGGIAANIAGSFGSTNFGALVRAFEQHSVMRVLAEPTLTAVSGETASFLAGGQFPYPTSVDDGDIGFTFRDFGVALEFTPVVVGDGRISLTVATEISELTTEGSLSAGDIQIPGISIRKANTTVELPSGGTMSIAGMLLQRDASAHTGLPGLKNLPVLGQLFSSTDYQKQETELVILVTPYIVKPGQEKDFRLPTDGFAPASDFDMFVLGRLHKVYGSGDPNTASAKAALKAPFGFILE